MTVDDPVFFSSWLTRFEALAAARATKSTSLQAYLEGLKRFDVLTADLDIDVDRILLDSETRQGTVVRV